MMDNVFHSPYISICLCVMTVLSTLLNSGFINPKYHVYT